MNGSALQSLFVGSRFSGAAPSLLRPLKTLLRIRGEDSAGKEEGSCGEELTGSQAGATAVPRGRIVVIGNGMVGFKLCEKLIEAKEEHLYEIVVFGDEPRPAYDRMQLTSYFSGKQPKDLELAPAEWYAEKGISLHVGERVVSIDRKRKHLRTDAGLEIAYDKLVLATGSYPYVPEIEGADVSGVFIYRTIEDLQKIEAYSKGCERAAVIGGGLLGLEAAKAFQDLGLKVTVLDHSEGLMSRQLDLSASVLLRQMVEDLGVGVVTHAHTQKIEACEGVQKCIHLEDGRKIETDMIVLAAGIRPRSELAEACGLVLGINGGIIVNDHLQTSDHDIYAIGECAMHQGMIYGFVAPGYKMVSVLVDCLIGKVSRFEKQDLATRLKLMGVEVITIGDNLYPGSVVSYTSKNSYRQLVLKNNRMVGATLVGPCVEAGRIQGDVERNRLLWPWHLSRFRRNGTIWETQRENTVLTWPAGAVVCNCTGVTRGDLGGAMARGCATVEKLASETGASTVCGSCKHLLAQLAGMPLSAAVPSKYVRWLVGVSVAALLGAVAALFLDPLDYSESVQKGSIDALWRSSLLKQVSGYSLLGVSLLTLFLSLRKRIKYFEKWGDYPVWRILHAAVGVACLLLTVFHTGMRLGSNLNFVLMLDFLILILVGALAGGVTALEHRFEPNVGMRLRRCWTWTHILLVWPLPVLILFHILSVYYF